MSKEAMMLALEALEHCKDVIVERGLNGSPEFAKKWGLTLPLERSEKAITALREALAEQPAQQEPAWRTDGGIPRFKPAQRTWVGLTQEEFRDFASTFEYGTGGLIRAIEAKLKEKNT